MNDTHFNKLSPAEDERLAVLSEECGEVVQAIAKIQRHGYTSRNPFKLNAGDNRERLAQECGDVMAAIQLLITAEDLDGVRVRESAVDKLESIYKWLHRQPIELLRKAVVMLKDRA